MSVECEGIWAEGEAILPLVSLDPLEAIVARVLEGEVDAFEELVAQTENLMLGLAWRMLRDREQARDAAQETYLRIYRSLASYQAGQGFKPWMYRIATNVCLDMSKKRPFHVGDPETLDALPHEDVLHADDAILRDQHRAIVRQALDCLTPSERKALVLRDLEGLSTEDVAQSLGIKPVTVRSQIASARTKLQTFCKRLVGGGL